MVNALEEILETKLSPSYCSVFIIGFYSFFRDFFRSVRSKDLLIWWCNFGGFWDFFLTKNFYFWDVINRNRKGELDRFNNFF